MINNDKEPIVHNHTNLSFIKNKTPSEYNTTYYSYDCINVMISQVRIILGLNKIISRI